MLARLIRYLWPPKQCRTCYHGSDDGTLCFYDLGFGYGSEVAPDGHCKNWKKRGRTKICRRN